MKLIHASDFHLDSPFHRLEPAKAAQRRRELRALPARLAQLARTEGAELLLLPGDLFDGERVYPETIAALKGALGEMGIPVFIAPGNHDHVHPRSPYIATSWPDNVHIFTAPRWEQVELPGLNCVVHGRAFDGPHLERSPLAGLTIPRDGRIHLLCLHGEVGREGRYGPIAPSELAACGAHYAALGHVHACSGLQREGEVYWAYPGCPEGRGFDELGDKGALAVEVEAGHVSARLIPLCQRRHRIEILTVGQPLPGVESPDLIRFLVRGEGAAPPDVAQLAAQLAPLHFHVEVRDETTLPQDLWARQQEDSLTGLFLRELRSILDNAGPEERDRLILAARFGLAALEGGEDIRP